MKHIFVREVKEDKIIKNLNEALNIFLTLTGADEGDIREFSSAISSAKAVLNSMPTRGDSNAR